jgi:hypothetical protein
MNPASRGEGSWTWIQGACTGPVRFLELQHVQDDTYVIIENGGVSLSDKASLTLLLEELRGRDNP